MRWSTGSGWWKAANADGNCSGSPVGIINTGSGITCPHRRTTLRALRVAGEGGGWLAELLTRFSLSLSGPALVRAARLPVGPRPDNSTSAPPGWGGGAPPAERGEKPRRCVCEPASASINDSIRLRFSTPADFIASPAQNNLFSDKCDNTSHSVWRATDHFRVLRLGEWPSKLSKEREFLRFWSHYEWINKTVIIFSSCMQITGEKQRMQRWQFYYQVNPAFKINFLFNLLLNFHLPDYIFNLFLMQTLEKLFMMDFY